VNTNAERRRLAAHAPAGRRAGRALVAGLGLAWVIAGPVMAHADLVGSDPKDRAVLAAPPSTITLAFSEALDPAKSSFRLIAAGRAIGTGKVAGDGTVMTLDGLVLDGRPLGPGRYEIQWTSVAGDGDLLRGTLTFTVSEPTPAPATATPAPGPTVAPSAQASIAATAAPTPATSPAPAPGQPVTSTVDVLLPIVAALVLVAGASAFLLRRSRGS